MPGSSTKFTDHNLKLFYGNLLNHYKECTQKHCDINAIYNEMYLAVQYALESPYGTLNHLDRLEKRKVYDAFNAIFRALPQYRKMNSQQQRAFNPPKPEFNVPTVYVINSYNNYNFSDRILFSWLFLSSITPNSHSHHHFHHHGDGCWPSNQHKHKSSSNDDLLKVIAALVILALVLFVVVLALIALYYMLNEFANSIERFWYGEGWLKAALMLAASAAFGAGSTILTLTFASTPLIALALFVGLNPVGIVIAATVSLGIIGAGIGCFAMSLLSDSIEQKVNEDAMDPADPERFRLTASEEKSLIKKNIDPVTVKCAIVALRAEMANVLGNESPIPSYFTRHFGEADKVQELLQKVRQLRNGEILTIEVGDLYFDCRTIRVAYTQQFFTQQPFVQQDALTYSGITPSAPPLDCVSSEEDQPQKSW